MMIGLEVHQRLNTGKLFCRCPCSSSAKSGLTIRRRQHSVKGELGGSDIAALREGQLDREFEYAVFDNSCLVECDEEPPHNANSGALAAAVAAARHLQMDLADEIFVMRKTVIDGSNTSAFQRTAVIGLNGKMGTSKGDVRIQSLCLEEESASIIGEKDGLTFGLDRLGIPLIEIATEPDIIDGEHAREVAESLGMMLRMGGAAARGIGTIRQDVNVSIEGGARIEIKGVQELDEIPAIIANEIKRQEALLKIIEKTRDTQQPKKIKKCDVSGLFSEGPGWVRKALAGGSSATGVLLPGLAGMPGIELYEGRRFGTELSDYAKAFGFGGIMHSDEDFKKYGADSGRIAGMLGAGTLDAFFVIVGSKGWLMEQAIESIVSRAYLKEVPKETRRALKGGGSQYMRPMATFARMYPETDVESIPLTEEIVKDSERHMPRDPESVFAKIRNETNDEFAKKLIKSRHLDLYEDMVRGGADPHAAAYALTDAITALSREGLDLEVMCTRLPEILKLHAQGKITKKGVEELMRLSAINLSAAPAGLAEENSLWKISGEELSKLVEREKGDLKRIMGAYRLRIEGEELLKEIEKYRKRK